MPVDTRHASYNDALPRWKKARDFAAGVKAVKAAGEAYLPRLSLDTPTDYLEYKERAVFFAGTTRALEGLMGALFADEPKADVPEAMKLLLDSFGQDTSTLFEFAKRCALDALTVGRGLIVVDTPSDLTHDPRPSAVFYPAEAVINWRTETIGGKQMLTLLVIEENVTTPKSDDPFILEESLQWRVWTLEKVGPVATAYRAVLRVHEKGEDGKLVVTNGTGDGIIPSRSNTNLDEIPACFIGSADNSADVDPIPIEALVEVNAAHYKVSADYYQTLHKIGCPTPYLLAADADSTKGPDGKSGAMPLGSKCMLVSTDVNAKIGFAAVTPEQVAPLKEELANLVSLMAVLGARMLETQKTQVEAADTLRLRQNGQTSVLENIANTLSAALTKALQWMAFWTGNDESVVSASINKQFADTSLQAEMITAITGAVTGGVMSKETAIYNFKEGRLLPPEVTEEDELERIKAGEPAPPAPVPVPVLGAG